jgi:hypothetical protein
MGRETIVVPARRATETPRSEAGVSAFDRISFDRPDVSKFIRSHFAAGDVLAWIVSGSSPILYSASPKMGNAQPAARPT